MGQGVLPWSPGCASQGGPVQTPGKMTAVSISVGSKFSLQKVEILVVAALTQMTSYTVSYKRHFPMFRRNILPPFFKLSSE
jgi:hypothetical protein